ncbi:MAG: hypothetical protein ACKO8U_02730, partial [Pirellula sp.]
EGVFADCKLIFVAFRHGVLPLGISWCWRHKRFCAYDHSTPLKESLQSCDALIGIGCRLYGQRRNPVATWQREPPGFDTLSNRLLKLL